MSNAEHGEHRTPRSTYFGLIIVQEELGLTGLIIENTFCWGLQHDDHGDVRKGQTVDIFQSWRRSRR